MAAAASAAPFLGPDSPVHDTSQTAYVSPLALLKILVHAAWESPVAAMGVILGEEVDGFSVRVVDAFPLPRCAASPRPSTPATSRACSPCSTKPTVQMVRCKLTCSLGENVQPVSSAKGLYLSWISFHISSKVLWGGTAQTLASMAVPPIMMLFFTSYVAMFIVSHYCQYVNRASVKQFCKAIDYLNLNLQAFEQLNPRAILVAVDPVRSATGNFTMNAFRSVTSYHETSSNVGALNREYYSVAEDEKPFFELDIFAQGLASVFYSILISHRKNDLEINILKSMDKMGSKGSSSEDCRSLCQFPVMSESEKKNVEEMLIDLLTKYQNEEEMQESDVPENPPDAENHLEELKNLMSACILQIFGMMLAWSSF
uniref:JAB1/MPN/MOV34 metalloenzyme domain-containing protein n=1 Tax=Oryza nivara TaxID=4536 RepID=A0A0E0HW98_ORYNI